eukprot:2971811-Prymnesium_polylepis.1
MAQYNVKKGERDQAQSLLESISQRFVDTQLQMVNVTEEIHNILLKLQANAARQAPADNVQYIEELIEQEKAEKRRGYDKRIQQLKQALETAKTVQELRSEGFDPMQKFRSRANTAMRIATNNQAREASQQGWFQMEVKKRATRFLDSVYTMLG